ncbi:MAG: ABC transporter ATP-binding protein [Saccharofermentanales bacterium]
MLQLIDVVKSYGGQNAVDHLNLTINKGELITLIGPSGCGKTTTLKMINRVIEPDNGQIIVNGQDILKQDPIKLRRGIGYVIQQTGLFPNMTISDNISVVGRLQGWSKSRCKERAAELLSLIDMNPEEYMERYPRELSGGQQQRIGVLRALATEPDIILMDEPFGALDPITREQLQNELINLHTRLQKTIVFVTHDMDEALKIADRIVLMREGKIVQAAAPEEMLRNPADDFVASFIGKARMLSSPEDVSVDDVMIMDPVTIEPERGVAEALDRMRKRRVDSLMVIDHRGVLLGVVTIKDLQQGLLKGGRVRDVIKGEPAAISIGQSVRDAVQFMARKRIGYLPVVDENNKLKGLITRASLVSVLSDVLWADPDTSSNGTETTTEQNTTTEEERVEI